MIFVPNSIGYSTNDYSIDIPVNFEKDEIELPGNYKSDDASFYYSYNSNMQNINIVREYIGEINNFSYNKESLDKVTEAFNDKGDAFYGFEVRHSVINSKIITFGKSNYNGFYLRSVIAINSVPLFVDQYITISGNYMYGITICSKQLDYLNSTEVKNVVKSFKIENYIPIDGSTPTFKIVLIIVASIVILLLIIIFVAEMINTIKRKIKSKPINFNEYNIAASNIKSFNDNNKKEIYRKPKIRDYIYKKSSGIKNKRLVNELQASNSNIKKVNNKISKTKLMLIIVLIAFGIGVIFAIVLENPFIILDSLITPVIYFLYPYTCIKSNINYTNKEARKIAITNSVVVAILFAIIRTFTTGEFTISAGPPVVYGSIVYSLLKENNENEKEDK